VKLLQISKASGILFIRYIEMGIPDTWFDNKYIIISLDEIEDVAEEIAKKIRNDELGIDNIEAHITKHLREVYCWINENDIR